MIEKHFVKTIEYKGKKIDVFRSMDEPYIEMVVDGKSCLVGVKVEDINDSVLDYMLGIVAKYASLGG